MEMYHPLSPSLLPCMWSWMRFELKTKLKLLLKMAVISILGSITCDLDVDYSHYSIK